MERWNIYDSCILIIDDQIWNIELLKETLEIEGYTNVHALTDPLAWQEVFQRLRPDLLLLDLLMPYKDGYTIMHEMSTVVPDRQYLPILVLTADITPEAKKRALESGARDFLYKPFSVREVLLRIKNLLETRHLYLKLYKEGQELEEEIRSRTRDLEEINIEALERLARTVEYRDGGTGEHTRRVGHTSGLIARELGLGDRPSEMIRLMAPLHDIGKIAIPDSILLKEGKLTSDEYERMKMHTTIGARILHGSSQLMQVASDIAISHHERWDGHGYPHGLAGEAIPLVGRIVAVADVFDALMHARPYKRAWTLDEALYEIRSCSGSMFDPGIVEAFEYVLPEVVKFGVAVSTPH